MVAMVTATPLLQTKLTYSLYNICDRIWENVHSSHIQFFSFEDSEI